jgi:signal transduction histidine kinase
VRFPARGSLRLRLLLAGAGAVALALVVAWAALTAVFARHLERRAVAEAETHLRTLIAGASLEGDALRLAAEPADPAFGEAYGGLYWQFSTGGKIVARSRSLWDAELALPADELSPDGAHVHTLIGPRGARLLAVERPLTLTAASGPRRYRVVVAQDMRALEEARAEFGRDLAFGLALLALILFAASVAQIDVGLRPLGAMRERLQAIREGRQDRLRGVFPAEVTPLAEEINALLDAREAALTRARGRAADLAHGLKTPLAALAAGAERLAKDGEREAAAEIGALGAMMERHVHRELARARIAAGAARGPGAAVRLSAELVAAAVARVPSAQGKSFDFDIPDGFTVAMDRADLEEILGNLVENAARYARSVVRIAARAEPSPTLEVGDDGVGVAQSERERLLLRGERLDSRGSGTGLGLSIVADVAEAYGATFRLDISDLGGLAAILTLPAQGKARR